jgi:hypothetical protein
MKEFIQRHLTAVIGFLSGFDRLVFRGTLRNLAFAEGLMRYLNVNHVLLKDAGAHFAAVSCEVRRASLARAERQSRPVVYLSSAGTDKEAQARKIAQRDGIKEGLICVLTSVEPCQTFEIHRHRETRRLELRSSLRKCLHAYHYWLHPELGWMHARVQTWFPFTIRVCLNGREWLARQLDRQRLKYTKSDNCFLWLEDVTRAQELAWRQLQTNWPRLLDGLARQAKPCCPDILGRFESRYYWSAYQTEWATDVMFKNATQLAQLYPRLIRHGITTFGSADVLRFLGRHTTVTGGIHGGFKGEVVTDLGEFALNGLRNRDLQARFYSSPAPTPREARRRSGRTTRQLRLLRSHALIRKVRKTHRYQLTDKGRAVVVALGAAKEASIRRSSELAA